MSGWCSLYVRACWEFSNQQGRAIVFMWLHEFYISHTTQGRARTDRNPESGKRYEWSGWGEGLACGNQREAVKRNWRWFGFRDNVASWRWRWRSQPCKDPGSLSQCWSLQEQRHKDQGAEERKNKELCGWTKEEMHGEATYWPAGASQASAKRTASPSNLRVAVAVSWVSVWHYVCSPLHWELS